MPRGGPGRPWTTSEMKEAERLWKLGVGTRTIGSLLGRSPAAIGGFARQHRDKFPARRRTMKKGESKQIKICSTATFIRMVEKEALNIGVTTARYLDVLARAGFGDHGVRRKVTEQINAL